MSYSTAQIWLIIALLGLGTYLIRLSFLGLIGDRKLPDRVLRHLRYTPVAMLPALVAPLAVWPAATGGEPDGARMIAAGVTLAVAYWRKNMLWGVFAGAATLVILTNLN
ncbi:MAG: AzlD domain-containing protein [Silicimonas sp.]|nr:AzlD domain-containing protein [Silicimonas sp.]